MKILFMCVANSARSQIAEGLAKKIFPSFEIKSAGSRPGKLNPNAVAVMKEIGIDITKQYSKPMGDLPLSFINHLDYVITLCAEEVCPSLMVKAKKLHWPFPDPATNDALTDHEVLKRFRQTRDCIFNKLQEFKP